MPELTKVLTVSEFNNFIKTILNELGYFSVSGEITELTVTAKKGVYITLSDGKANLKLSGYAPTIKGINLVEKGMKVVAKGYNDIYVPYGSYCLSISSIEPDGDGSLAIAYEKLKRELESKGYFDNERKKPLPEYITRIAILTGKDSAAFSDFTKILVEHNSGIEVDFYPVIVQGENSVTSILKAINAALYEEYDVVVLTRGGGSLEDLKSFNSLELADTIFKSRIPFIVGVGHEKDESIADFVADIRASTPSQCAYYIVQQNEKFIDNTIKLTEFMYAQINDYIVDLNNKLNESENNLNMTLSNLIDSIKEKIEFSKRLLKSFDIQSVLKRGFCVVEKNSKQVFGIADIEVGDSVSIRLYDGKAEAIVNNKS
jgi:exodeoxyribonuclease VII large subunit